MLLLLQALDLIRGKNVLLLLDSSLEGQYANEDATALVELASKCLQYEARDRPDIKFLLTAVAPLQKKEVASQFFSIYIVSSILGNCFTHSIGILTMRWLFTISRLHHLY